MGTDHSGNRPQGSGWNARKQTFSFSVILKLPKGGTETEGGNSSSPQQDPQRKVSAREGTCKGQPLDASTTAAP